MDVLTKSTQLKDFRLKLNYAVSFFFFFFMPSFLATYSLKVSIYAQYFSAKFFYVAIY